MLLVKAPRAAALALAMGAALLARAPGALHAAPDPGRADVATLPGLPRPTLYTPELIGPPRGLPEALRRAQSEALRTASPDQDDPYATIDACMTKEMENEGAPGAALAIVRDGRLIYTKGFGVKNVDTSEPVDPQTVFRIGSVTKMFTAAAVMQQVEAGNVDLQAPITKYIPEYKVAEEGATDAITVWHLLTQSSGLPDNGIRTLDEIDGPKTDDALGSWVTTQITTHVHAPGGTLWNYSNPNYMMAGLIAERASGIPYHQVMAERVFARAGLTNTTLLPADVLARGNYSTGYWVNPGTGEPGAFAPDSYDNYAFGPAGYAFSTVGDLARWAQILMDEGGDVLQPASAEAMQARQFPMHYTPNDDYGFGVFAEKYKGLDVRQHGGNVPGWGAYLLWIPSERFIVATLTNRYPATIDGSAYCAIDALLQPADLPPTDYTTPPDTWGKYVGDYAGWLVDGTFWRAAVSKTDDKLFMTLHDVPIDDQGTPFTSELVQAVLDTFIFDITGDGKPDLDFTFIQDPKDPETWWMRNRQIVFRRPALAGPTPTATATTTPTATPTAKPGPPVHKLYMPRLYKRL